MCLRDPTHPGNTWPFPWLVRGTLNLHSLKEMLDSKSFSQTPSRSLVCQLICTPTLLVTIVMNVVEPVIPRDLAAGQELQVRW